MKLYCSFTLPINNIPHRKTKVKRFSQKNKKTFSKNFHKIYKNLLTYTKRYAIIGVRNAKARCKMEEKKLTDEVVVKALEHCSHNRSCEYCYHNDERGSGEIVCRSRLMGKSLDLIHRLQKENEELKSPKFASWKLKFFNLKEEFDKELADHEEFTKKAKA